MPTVGTDKYFGSGRRDSIVEQERLSLFCLETSSSIELFIEIYDLPAGRRHGYYSNNIIYSLYI